MDHPVTVGMVIWGAIATFGCIALLGILLYVASIFADAFKR